MQEQVTLQIAVTRYLDRLWSDDKSASTRGTVERNLKLLTDHLGEEKHTAKLLPVHVAGFFKSEAVKTIHGHARAPRTIDQIRRTTRQFLTWAQGQGYVATLPLPKDEARRARATVR